MHDYHVTEMFIAAVGLAVAAIPEGLPAIMTITLAIGVTRMASRNAIIRKLPAVETMGAVSVICTDKTGTLTRNELSVDKIVTAEDEFIVTGSGYSPNGEFFLHNRPITVKNFFVLKTAISAAILCNESELNKIDGEWKLHGNPTDGALLTLALKAKMDIEFERKSFRQTDLIPFESVHKFMATLHHDHANKGYIFVKGAPENILEMCDKQLSNDGEQSINKEFWDKEITAMANEGQRVLAIAKCSTTSEHRTLKFRDLKKGLTIIGLYSLFDPPRDETLSAIEECQAAGIIVKMITGDHALTAKAIANKLNLGTHNGILTGEDIDQLTEEELAEKVNDIDVYARTSPEHKLRLVKALQRQGHIVAMTGDGVNDAPALKRADIGVSMGLKGTEASKEVSEMVLADDNFASIDYAVEEGRTVYQNLKKAILFILPTNGGEAFTLVSAILLGTMLPITPVQILWVNMITAVTLALSLAFEPSDKYIMKKPPRAPQEPILSKMLIWRICFVSFLLVLGTFGLFLYCLNAGSPIEHARTVAVNTLVAGEIVYLINCRNIIGSSLKLKSWFNSKAVLIAIFLVIVFQLIFTYLPLMQYFFGTSAMSLKDWVPILLFCASLYLLVELEKYVVRKFKLFGSV